MLLDFFFNVDSGTLAFFTTDTLSTLHLQYPFNGTPIIRSLYLSPSSSSTPVFNAANSDPKLLVSMLFCFFEYHTVGALLTKISTPVRDCRVTRLAAWFA